MQTQKANKQKHGGSSIEFGERLRHVMRLKNIDQVDIVRDLAINKGTVSEWCNGKVKAGAKNTRRLSRYIDCDFDWLFDGSGRSPVEGRKLAGSGELVSVAYVEDTYASAGGGVINYESAKQVMNFDRDFLTAQLGIQHFENIHIIHAVGDSMEPTIHPGDMLFINPGEREIITGAVYVLVIGDETMVKRAERNPISSELTLRSDNDQYQPIKISKKDLQKVHVIGRVIGSFRKM